MSDIASVNIVEIFDSIQGEGKFIGARQLFVRLSGCPLNCPYCDTDHAYRPEFTVAGHIFNNPMTPAELYRILTGYFSPDKYHSVSFTGGEPLLYVPFLKEVSRMFRKAGSVKLFLETSGYDPSKMLEVADYFDYISLDVKNHEPDYIRHADRLISAAGLLSSEQIYIKIPLSSQYGYEIIEAFAPMLKQYALKEVWLQPLDNIFEPEAVKKWQLLLADYGIDSRFIPQMHKLIDIP